MTLLKIFFTSAVFFASAAFAADRATKDEAKAMNDAAVAHVAKVGWDKAKTDFGDKANADWHKKDLYVFAVDMKGIVQAHGVSEKLVGKDLLAVKDPTGREWIKEMITVGNTKGQGWVEYTWQHPDSKKVEDKISYVRKINGADLIVGVGVYK
jgi:signal transduction histidine kinase